MRVVWIALVLAGPACAQIGDGKKEFDQKYKSAAQKAAREHVTLGKFASGKKLHAVAVAEFRRALALDADSTDAKKGLNWKHDGKAWVEDPANPPKSANEGAPDAVKRATDEYDVKRLAAAKKSAKEFEDVATWATKKGLKEEAKVAWHAVLYYDDSSSDARKGSGWVKDGDYWVGPADVEARAAEAKRIAAADAGAKSTEATDIEQKLGWALLKRKSKHCEFEGMVSESELEALVKVAEAAHAAFLELFEVEKGNLEDPIRGVYVRTTEHHNEFLAKYLELKGRELDQQKSMSGWMSYRPRMTFQVRQGDRDVEFLKDWTIHCVVEFLLGQYTDEALPAWVGEGIPYWFTYMMTKSAQTNCITFETKGDIQEDWDDVLSWKASMKRMVLEGRDPGARDVMGSRLNALDGAKGVKGWALVEWMMATRRKEFLELVKDLGGAVPAEDAVKKALGFETIEAMDAAWREYVRENY